MLSFTKHPFRLVKTTNPRYLRFSDALQGNLFPHDTRGNRRHHHSDIHNHMYIEPQSLRVCQEKTQTCDFFIRYAKVSTCVHQVHTYCSGNRYEHALSGKIVIIRRSSEQIGQRLRNSQPLFKQGETNI